MDGSGFNWSPNNNTRLVEIARMMNTMTAGSLIFLNNAICEEITKHRELYSASIYQQESFVVAQVNFTYE